MKQIFLVEDDTAIAKNLTRLLRTEGFAVTLASTQAEAFTLLDGKRFDLALIDISLPDGNGFTVCTEIKETQKIPVIFLTATGDEASVVTGLNMGADDFIVKPFDGSVLIAKIQALLRRTYDFAGSVPVMEHRGALLNLGDNTLVYQGERINLSKNEYRILLALMENKGKVVSRERLMERLWETDSFVDENTLTVNVNRLRKKLDGAGLEGFITTKVGVGYIITVDQELHRP